MRREYIFLLLLFTGVRQGFSQKMPVDYFNEAAQFFESKQYNKAVSSYKYIVDNHKRNDLYPESFYNLGYTYLVLEKYDSSITIFKAILESDFDENKLIGGDIMASPYANFRHRSSDLLSDIYYQKKNYDSSLYYLALSDSVYEYMHFCGNEYASNEIYIALKYADLYQKLNKPQRAVSSLLKASFIEIEDNSEVLTTLKTLLKKQPQKNYKNDLDKALMSIYTKQLESDGKLYQRQFIRFLDTEIFIPYGYEDQQFNKSKAISAIKKTNFYKTISAL